MSGIKQGTGYSFLKRYIQLGISEHLPRSRRPKDFSLRDARILSWTARKIERSLWMIYKHLQ
jgi:hypothetical protein